MSNFLKKISLISHSATLFRDFHLAKYGVSGYQAKYLLALSGEGGITQDGLAKKLLVNKSNVARQIGSLEEAGYVLRVQQPMDKRVYMLYLTPKGKELIATINEVNEIWGGWISEGLTEKQTDELNDILDKLVENAKIFSVKPLDGN